MHSSRMRTTRLCIVPGGVVTFDPGKGGIVTFDPGQGGRCWPGGGGVVHSPPKYYRMTDACENITFATQAVKIH